MECGYKYMKGRIEFYNNNVINPNGELNVRKTK